MIEPTGRFHRRLHQSLFDRGFEVVLVNPTRSRRFAEATGELAKTDRVDAAMLAAYGKALPNLGSFRARKPRSSNGLRPCWFAGRAWWTTALSLLQTAGELGGEEEQRLKKIAASIGKEIAELKTSVEAHLRSDPDFAARYQILRSIPGIGFVNAASLCCWMPELGHLENRQAASLLRVAPYSLGQRQGTGAAAHPRRQKAAPVRPCSWPRKPPIDGTRTWPALYDRLIANGKRHKVAIVAIMRKLIILANVLLRDGRKWAPNAPKSAIPSCG